MSHQCCNFLAYSSCKNATVIPGNHLVQFYTEFYFSSFFQNVSEQKSGTLERAAADDDDDDDDDDDADADETDFLSNEAFVDNHVSRRVTQVVIKNAVFFKLQK